MAENRGDRIRRFENYEQMAAILGITFAGLSVNGLVLAIAGFSGVETISSDGSILTAEELSTIGLGVFLIPGILAALSFALSAKFKKISTDSLHYRAD